MHPDPATLSCMRTLVVPVISLLTITVIVFGALITVLQSSKRSWCKTTTVILGAATSIFTGINAKVFSADYRFLQQSSIDARVLIDQLNLAVLRLGLARNPRSSWTSLDNF